MTTPRFSRLQDCQSCPGLSSQNSHKLASSCSLSGRVFSQRTKDFSDLLTKPAIGNELRHDNKTYASHEYQDDETEERRWQNRSHREQNGTHCGRPNRRWPDDTGLAIGTNAEQPARFDHLKCGAPTDRNRYCYRHSREPPIGRAWQYQGADGDEPHDYAQA